MCTALSVFYAYLSLSYRTSKNLFSSSLSINPFLSPSIHPPKILKQIIFLKEPTVEEWSEEETEEVSISIHREEISEGTTTIQKY